MGREENRDIGVISEFSVEDLMCFAIFRALLTAKGAHGIQGKKNVRNTLNRGLFSIL